MSKSNKLITILLGFGILYLVKNCTAQDLLGLGVAMLMAIAIIGLFFPPYEK